MKLHKVQRWKVKGQTSFCRRFPKWCFWGGDAIKIWASCWFIAQLYYEGRMTCSRKRNCSALKKMTCFFCFFLEWGGSLEELSSLGQIMNFDWGLKGRGLGVFGREGWRFRGGGGVLRNNWDQRIQPSSGLFSLFTRLMETKAQRRRCEIIPWPKYFGREASFLF